MSYYLYILGNHTNTTLYVGVTNSIYRRISEHKSGRNKSFSRRYKCFKLLYYEEYSTIIDAIEREKQIKRRSRIKKEKLVAEINPDKQDLAMLRCE